MAAVDYGADAVYIGGSKFGARRGACNPVEEVARAVEYAHQYGVRIHATLNTLLFDGELADAEAEARALIAAGVDALIVQDMALRRMELPVELHASTQMCNMTPEQARFLGDCGFARVILERALSLEEIRAVAAAMKADVECFVHGAICVGYSGRCFLSRSMSERSGNRGACSQPCRLTYDLTDGRGRSYLSGRHLLSVRDLDLSGHIGELLDAGVTSFKIEGRLKDINYIRNVVAYYRRALDEALAARPQLRRSSVGVSRPDFRPDPAKSFTRGASEYFFAGRSAGVASFDTPKSVGEYVGRVVSCDARSFRLDGDVELAPGDGICFVTGRGPSGTNVNAVEGRRITPNRMEGIRPGVELYRNFDRRFNLVLERSRTRRVIPVTARVEFMDGGRTLRRGARRRRHGADAPHAGGPLRRHHLRGARREHRGAGALRAGIAPRRAAPRGARRAAPPPHRGSPHAPHPARRRHGALSVGYVDGRGERHQPPGRRVLPGPRRAPHRARAIR